MHGLFKQLPKNVSFSANLYLISCSRFSTFGMRSGSRYQQQPSQSSYQNTYNNNNNNNSIYKQISVKLPNTNDDALQLLMNWNFVKKNQFLRSLRSSIVKYGTLTEKQMQSLKNVFASNALNSRYVCYFEIKLNLNIFCFVLYF